MKLKKRVYKKFVNYIFKYGCGRFRFMNGHWWEVYGLMHPQWKSLGNKNARKILKRFEFCQKQIHKSIQTLTHCKYDED